MNIINRKRAKEQKGKGWIRKKYRALAMSEPQFSQL
jgi:hypothetical protein